MKKCLTCFWILIICFTNSSAQELELNLGMEDVEAYAQPAMWRLGHDPGQPLVYHLLADSKTKHGGNYSLKIFSNSSRAKFGSCYIQIPLPLPGKSVTLKGFLKTDSIVSGFGTLFLTLSNDSLPVVYDNLQEKGMALTGTQDWKEFSITLPISESITKISFGGLLVGQGTLWVDDLTLSVDDIKISKALVLQPEFKDPKTGKVRKFK
jgi:hypothetical protein